MGVQSAAVTGFVAGENAAKYAQNTPLPEIDASHAQKTLMRVFDPMCRKGTGDAGEIAYRIHEAIVPFKYNRQREAARMKEALGIIFEAQDKLKYVNANDFHDLARYFSAESMAQAAEFTYRAALMRQESRMGHNREDFPARDDKNWFKWITIQKKGDNPVLEALEIPLENFPIKP